MTRKAGVETLLPEVSKAAKKVEKKRCVEG